MKQKIFIKLLKLLEKIIGKKLVYYSRNIGLGKTAAKADFGFWYAGDIVDMTDISYGILNNGLVEKEETDLVVKILELLMKRKDSLSFYDIGANSGYYGIMAAHLGKGKIKCYSFEPQTEYFNCLKESIYLNRLEDVIVPFNLALSDKGGEGDIYGGGSGASLEKIFLGAGDFSKRKIKVEKLDDLVKKENLESPDFVKIDVEGHELSVLKGAELMIKEFSPIMFIEIAYSLKSIGRDFVNENYQKTLDFIKSFGYEIFCQDGGKLIKVEGDDFKRDGVRMFLCLHREKHKFIPNPTFI